MAQSDWNRLRWVISLAAAGGLFWVAYVEIMHALGLLRLTEPVGWRVFIGGALIFGAAAAFEFYVYQTNRGAVLRRLPYGFSVLAHVLILLAIMATVLAMLRLPTYYLQVKELGELAMRPAILRDASLGVVVTLVFIAWSEVRSLIGPRTLRNVVLGRYRQPRRENRIFAFIDVAGSTGLAATLGDERFYAFLARFFAEIDDIIVDHGGEVHAYVGDAVIATWPLAAGRVDGEVVASVMAMRRHIAKVASQFQTLFGHVPRFRVAIHGGPVVAGECGQSKRQITYLGDVVNVCARLEQAAKAQNRKTVISQSLLDRLVLPPGVRADPLGEVALKGVSQPMQVSALEEERQI